jgi:PAS domain S-box-containing protein/putative nucleotidyltransferase with HDIG domain
MARRDAVTPLPAGEIYRSVFDEMLEGFALHEIICDDAGKPVDYRFIEANPAFELLTGLKRDQIVGRTVREVLPETEPEWIERYGEVALTGKPLQFRMHSAPLERTYDVRAYNSGSGLVATLFIDVTEQERVAHALERDERLYRAVVETSADGFWMMDRTGTILGVNTVMCRITGYDSSEIVGLNVRDVEASESPEQTTGRMAAIELEGSALFETTLRAKDGTKQLVEVNVAYWPIEGGRFFAFFRDIARRRRAEYLMRARAELLDLEKDAALDDILRRSLDKAELLTGSSIGFFHLVDPDQEHLVLQTWSTSTLATMCTAEGGGRHYPISEAGVWTESLLTRKPAIHNDYASMPDRKGMPAGHAIVTRELVVPVIRAGMVVGLMGVGNKTTDYVPEDIIPVEAMAYMAADVALHSKAQEEFERFFDLVPDLVAIVSFEGRFRRVNEQWTKTLGYASSEMLTHPFMEFVHPDDVASTEAEFARQLAGDSVTGFVNRYRAKDGTYHWLEWSSSPLMGEGLVFAVARDVTEGRLAEDALRVSEVRFRGLFENMVEGLAYCRMIYDDAGEPLDWVYLEVNGAFEKQTRIAGAAGRRVSEVIPGIREADPELFELYSRVAQSGVPERMETFVSSLGDWFDLRVYSPEKDHFVAVFDVITKRKRLEGEAADRETWLRALLDNAPYGAHMYELLPGDRLIFIGYNARAAEMLKIDHEPLIGLTMEEAFPGNVGSEASEAYRRVAREGGTWSTEQYAYDDAQGIAGIFEVYAFSFGSNRVSVFFRDVTELRRAEIDLQDSETALRRSVTALANAIRTLRALSACNEALVHAESEQVLLQDICNIAVDQGGYSLAWIGYAEHDEAHTVRPVALAGAEDGYLDSIDVTWGDADTAEGPGGTVIKTGQQVLIDSIPDDPRFVPWRGEALSRGYGSLAAFPVKFSSGQTIGVVLFYAGASAHFEGDEVALLAELVSDLSYGIETLRARETQTVMADQLTETNERLEGLLRQVTVALGRVVEARDPYTSGHEERVARLGRQIALEMGLSLEEADGVEIAGLVHDIGKLSVPAEILTKPSALSPIELRLIREHSKSGYEILRDISFASPVADIVLQHHERMDGSGYPNGIKGEEILLPARILAVADVVEAMASHRPYRPARGISEAIAEISSRPDLYDPNVSAACVRLFEAGSIEM